MLPHSSEEDANGAESINTKKCDKDNMDYQEYEIDLHKVLYKACMKWRSIIVIGIIAALLLAGKEAFDGLSVLNDEEKLTNAQVSFEREHSSWESQETVLLSKIENLQNEKERQEEYNEKSLLMDIDPLNEYYGSFSLYVDSGYKVDPSLTMQNIDYTGRILSAYSRYMNSGELYEYMLANTNITDEQKYLKEVLTFGTNADSAMINVTAVGKSSEQVQELLTLVKNGIAEKYDVINNTVDDHTYTIVNETDYSYINYNLQDTQKENIDKIAEINTKIQEVNLDLEKWKAQNEPQFQYSSMRILKNAIKKAIIGGVVGCVLAFCWFAAASILGQGFSDEKLALCAGKGARLVGTVYTDKASKPLKGIDRIISKVFGERTVFPDFERSCALAGSNAKSMAAAAGEQRMALIGALDEDLLKDIGSRMQASSEGCSIDVLGNILSDPDAVNKLGEYSSVAVAAAEKTNNLSQVSRQFELLKIWGKNVMGAVVVK